MWHIAITYFFTLILAIGLVAGVSIKWPWSILVFIGIVGLGNIIGLMFSKVYERKER